MKNKITTNNIYFELEDVWWYNQPWKFDKRNDFKYSSECFYIIIHPTFYYKCSYFTYCYFPFIYKNISLKINQCNE